jgi:CBS domain-containing protein
MSTLPVHRRVNLTCNGHVRVASFVRCPDGDRWAPMEECRRCARFAGLQDSVAECRLPAFVPAMLAPEDVSITEVMEPDVLCVEAGATVASVAAALDEEDTPLAVVVDRDQHAIGVCSRRSLDTQPATSRVEECMTPVVVTMLEVARVSDAIDLFANRALHHVPVLADGRVTGVATSRALVRWLARALRGGT